MRLIDADELKKQAYRSGDWDKPLVVDVEAIDDAPTIDQWHYPSRGEYPTEGEEVWVSWSSNGDYGVEKFYHNKNGEEVWGMKLSPPYAWQHIIPPKEEE